MDDMLDRLTGVTYLDTLVDAFAMDDLGNRTGSETQRNTAHTYAVDSLTNRYTAIDAVPIAHDTADNLISVIDNLTDLSLCQGAPKSSHPRAHQNQPL